MNHYYTSRLFKYFCNWLALSLLILGGLYLIFAPAVTKLGEGVHLVQFLNGGGQPWLIKSRGYPGSEEKGQHTLIQLTDDKTSRVEVRTIDGLIKAEATVSPAQAPETPFPATREELEDACLLVWRFEIPGDLAADEYATTEWRIGNEKIESGLSFEEVPPGETVMVLLWTGDFMHYIREGGKGDPPDGMPYCIRYPGPRQSQVEKWGRMTVPRGWETAYGNLGSGDYLDSGWLLLQSNEAEAKSERYFAFLELVYRFKTDRDTAIGKAE